jgi:hypothetical protein
MLPSQYPEVNSYPTIKYVCEKQVDMLFNDIRCLLKAPLPGCTVGFNLTIATMILNLLSGFSRRFYRPSGNPTDSERFKNMIINFLPWDNSSVDINTCADVLYSAVRNPLIHELGIKGDKKVVIYKSGKLSDAEIKELEDSLIKPSWLPEIIINMSYDKFTSEWLISVGAIYWGVHRLLHNLLANSEHALRAEARLKEIIKSI